MSSNAAPSGDMIDLAFAVHGKVLLRDHAHALQQALCAQLPWLAQDPLAGIHAVKLVPGSETLALLSARTRLLLRVSTRRLDELRALEGRELNVAGSVLRLGGCQARQLLPLATLYASRVASDSADELVFMAGIEEELARLEIGGQRICGKRRHMAVGVGSTHVFSLMLHALSPQQSLRLQQLGLGAHRLLGCGIFVPHKSAAAV